MFYFLVNLKNNCILVVQYVDQCLIEGVVQVSYKPFFFFLVEVEKRVICTL